MLAARGVDGPAWQFLRKAERPNRCTDSCVSPSGGFKGAWPVSNAIVNLIAEDEDDNREGYAEYLSFLGYRIEQAPDGDRAWALAQEVRPDVLLLDLALPG